MNRESAIINGIQREVADGALAAWYAITRRWRPCSGSQSSLDCIARLHPQRSTREAMTSVGTEQKVATAGKKKDDVDLMALARMAKKVMWDSAAREKFEQPGGS